MEALAVTLWEGQTQSLTLPMPGAMSESYTVNRYTTGSGAHPATSGLDYKPLDVMTSRPGGTANIVAKVDGLVEGDETFLYTYYVSWYGDTGYGGMGMYYTQTVWSITLHDAKNDTGTSSPDPMSGTPGFDKLTGAGGDDTLAGLAGNDTLLGGADADRLAGGTGNDRLSGNAGADKFLFAESGAMNADTIADFLIGADKIMLDETSFPKLEPTPGGGLPAANFHLGAAAGDAGDYIVYDPSSGNLYYDPDGDGVKAQKLIATLTGSPDTVSASDFRVN